MRILDVKPPEGLTVEALREIADRQVLADLTLKVVTPMFGGGVKPGEVDELHPIRASAIRGHLRFWWRACNAARFESLEEMHREERLLWGSATRVDKKDPDVERTWGQGLIGVEVVWTRTGQQFDPSDGPQYVTWPFQQQTIQKGRTGIQFRLRLTVNPHEGELLEATDQASPLYSNFDACKAAVVQALWAWITWGGVGARTRRGCGTLLCETSCEDLLPASLFQPPVGVGELVPWLHDRLTGKLRVGNLPYVTPGTGKPRDFTSLSETQCWIGDAQQPIAAWGNGVAALKDFAKAQGGSIRRAGLGLPRLDTGVKDPSRMASPVVVKPIVLSETLAVPAALMLAAPDRNVPGGRKIAEEFISFLDTDRKWTVVVV